jgi:hypothetical protein
MPDVWLSEAALSVSFHYKKTRFGGFLLSAHMRIALSEECITFDFWAAHETKPVFGLMTRDDHSVSFIRRENDDEQTHFCLDTPAHERTLLCSGIACYAIGGECVRAGFRAKIAADCRRHN